jgi:hypothetical protein
MTRNTYWGGLTSLEKLRELLLHVVEVTYWAAAEVFNPRACLALRREALGQVLAVEGGSRSIKEHADSVVRLAQANAIAPDYFPIAWNMRQLVKKFEYGCSMSQEAAKADFLARNADLEKTSPLPYELRACMRALLKQALPEPPQQGCSKWLSEGRFGPGSVLEGGATLQRKLQHCVEFERVHGFPIWDDRAPSVCPEVARLQAVPKDLNRLRTITVESIGRAWAQQAVRTTILRSVHSGALRGSIMDQTLGDRNHLESGVDVWGRGLKRAEPRQKIRCRLGARNGSLSTLDLSNASDTMRYDDVMSVFPAWLTPLLDEVRSPYVEVEGRAHRLNMYAGMGNATTFPVETLFFWALFTGVANIVHGRFCTALGRTTPSVRCGNVTVYGDDIVCRTRDLAANPWALSYVKQTSIVINGDKSGCSLGPGFREACGEVSYHNVSMPSTSRLYGAENTRIGAARYCDFASRMLDSPIPELSLLGFALCTWDGAPRAPYCVLDEPDSACLAYRVPSHESALTVMLDDMFDYANAPKSRWNSRFQRQEIQLDTVAAYERDYRLQPASVSEHGGDEAWYEYQLGLLSSRAQCVVAETGPSAKGTPYRQLRCPVPHHNRMRRRWVPGSCSPRYKAL